MSTRDAPPPGTVLLTCGDPPPSFPTTDVVACAAIPTRAEVDPLLDDATRLVVAGSDAALAAVVVRLLRRERLDLAVAFVPTEAPSEAAAVWGLPIDPSTALALAVDGTATPAPLVRDDRGGVIAGVHRVGPFSGVSFCDEHELVRGEAAGLTVRPDPSADTRGGLGPGGGGVAVTLHGRRRFLRARAHTVFGRAATVGIRPGTVAAASRDGVDDPKPLERRSWYRHTADWQLVRP